MAAIGDDVAYVWRLSLVHERTDLDGRGHLDTGHNEKGTIVVAFKDIPRSNIFYQHIWGRDELLPVAFTGSIPFDHFRSFGKVHKGFLNRYNQVADELRTWLRPGANVLITGSFAGGSMAALAFADWLSDSSMGLGMVYGVTFGAAQVGDKLFQKAFRELGRYEPSKASYGFFEQLIAADERTGTVDIATRFPSTIFENFVSYPAVHSLDCLRTVLPVEKIVQSSPGHLRAFRPIGRRRFLYFGSYLRPAPSRLPFLRPSTPRLPRDGLNTVTSTFFILQTNRMAHYMERLISLYADSQRALRQSHRENAPRFSKLRVRADLPKHPASPSTCHGTMIPTPSEKLTVSLTISSGLPPSGPLGLGINLCSSCSPHMSFNETLCHPIPHISNNTNPDYAAIPPSGSASSTPLVFSTLRPIEAQTCMQLALYWLQKPYSCPTDTLPREMVRVASAPLLEMPEVLSCTGQERCGLEFEGMRVTIESHVEALVQMWGKKQGRKLGVLTRGQMGVGRGKVPWIRGEKMRGDKEKKDARYRRAAEVLKQTGSEATEDARQGGSEAAEVVKQRDSEATEVLRQRDSDTAEVRKQRDSEAAEFPRNRDSDTAEVWKQRESEAWKERQEAGGLGDREIGGVGDSETGGVDPSEGWGQGEEDGWEMGGAMTDGGVRERAARNEGVGKTYGEMQRRDGAVPTRKVGWGAGKKDWRGGSSDGRVGAGMEGMMLGRKGGAGGAVGAGDFGRARNESGNGNKQMVEGVGRESGEVGQVWGRVARGVQKTRGNLGVGQEGMTRLVSVSKAGEGNEAMAMVSRAGEVEKGRPGCETEGWCYCEAVQVERCVKEVEEGRGWCRVAECVEMKCRCGGDKVCEKKEGVIFEMVGRKGEKEGRCVGKLGRLVEEMETGG